MEALSFNCDSRTGRSVSALGIVKAAALILMAALFLTVARHNSKHGYADNGDYLRLAQIVAAKPHGLSEAWPDAKNRQEWDKRYCKYWLPAWDLNDKSTIDEKTYLSSSWPFIFTANLLNRWAGKGVFNITVPGLVVNLLVFVIVLFTTIRANDIRRVILLLLFYVVFAHNGYQLFASTFYADFYALAGFLMFIIFFIRRNTRGALVSSIVSISKTQMVFMAIPAWLAFRNKLKGTIVVALLTFSIIVLSVQLRKGNPDYSCTGVNNVNRIFYGALMVSKDPLPHLARIGFKGQADRIGKNAFNGNGDIIGKVTAADFAKIVAREPYVVPRMLKKGVSHIGGSVMIHYLGVSEYPIVQYDAPFAMKIRGHMLEGVLSGKMAALCIIIALTACGLLYSWKDYRMANLIVMLVLSFVLSYIIAVVGDGFCELPKHLVITNFIYDLLRVVVIVNIVYVLIRILAGRQPFQESSPAH